MKKVSKFFRSFKYELIGLAALSVIAVTLLFIHRISGLIALMGTIVYAILMIILIKTDKRGLLRRMDTSGMTQMVSNIVEDMDSPVIIINEADMIIWNNDCAYSMPEISKHHITSGITAIFGNEVSYSNFSAALQGENYSLSVRTEFSSYKVSIFPLELNNNKLFGTVWYSCDEVERLNNEIIASNVRVAYIAIDNTDEITDAVKENRRFAAATVNRLLNEWAKEYSAILTEYERDKYIMHFESRYLKNMCDSRFDILDKVVEYSLRDASEPITISIGVSSESGTLAEKRDSAHAALSAATRGGGATAIVFEKSGSVEYGGRTKAVQRQTKIRSRICKDLLCNLLPKCSNVIIMGHLRPDFDSIASNIGIAKLAQMYDKEYCIVADRYDGNISKVVDMIADFPEYENVFVDAVYAQELLTPETLVVITDASNPDLFAARGVYENASKVVIIDHHALKTEFGGQVCKGSNIDPTASSASELVCEILEMSLNLSMLRQEEAQVLLSGILLDTQFFSRDTGTRTYSACMFLKNAGADVGKAKNLFKSNMKQFKAVTSIEQNMKVIHDKFAVSFYDECESIENKVIASKAADRLVDVEGISASFVLYKLDDGINLSARSDGSVNVISIAQLLGGGGHFQSAGALIKRKKDNKEETQTENENANVVFDINEAMEILIDAIESYIGNGVKEGKSV